MVDAGYGKNWNPAEYYKNSDIAESYDSERFKSLPGRVFNALEQRLIRKAFAGVPKSGLVGDVPCGTGRLADVLLKEGFRVLGIDISPQMLRVASSRLRAFGDRFETKVCDARVLADSGVKLDAVLCARVLMHFPLEEQIEFLRNVASVTSGRIVFTQGLVTPFHVARRKAKRLLLRENPAVYPLTPPTLKRLLAEAGLREVRRYSVLPLVSESIVFVTERAKA